MELYSGKLEKDPVPWSQRQAGRAFERAFLTEVLGLPRTILQEFWAATYSRVMKKDRKGEIIPEAQGGSLHLVVWSKMLQKYSERVGEIGPEVTHKLLEDFGLINIDLLTSKNLDQMRKIVERDPATLEKLRKGNPRLMLGDRYESLFSDPVTDDPEGMMIFGEIGSFHTGDNPMALFAPWTNLVEKYDIVPATVGINVHGILSAGLILSGKGMPFMLGAPQPGATPLPGLKHIDMREPTQLMGTHMRPDSNTGQRHFEIMACHQFATAQQLALATNPADRVAVAGPPTTTRTLRDAAGLYYIDRSYSRIAAQVYCWNDDGTAIIHTEATHLVGVK